MNPKKQKWTFSVWHPCQEFKVGFEWNRDGWRLYEFDVYLGIVAFGWWRF